MSIDIQNTNLLNQYKENNYNSLNDDDKKALREVFGRFATGICIATCFNENTPIGMTINSFSSVSLEPPLIMFCIAKTSHSLESFKNTNQFAINILGSNSEELSRRFAKHINNKYDGIEWQNIDNTPFLNGNIGFIICEQYNFIEAGDHYILIGKVLKTMLNNESDPLLYFKGQYHKL